MRKFKVHFIYILLISFLVISLPEKAEAAHPVLERLSKRYFKKNKLKKLGKRAQRAALDIDLEEYTIKPQHDIIGLEPSWMIKEKFFAEHYFNIISTLVFGEYDINPLTGYPRNPTAFKAHIESVTRDKRSKFDFNIIQAANYYNPKLNFLLHLTYSDDFGSNHRANRKSLLEETEVFRNLSDSLVNHLDFLSTTYKIRKEQLGIFVEFDFSDNKSIIQYFEFLASLKVQLGEEYKIYVVVPAEIRRNEAYSYAQIQELYEFTDRIVIDATNFNKYERTKPVPPTNLSPNTDFSLFGTLKKYLIDPDVASQIPHGKAMEYIRSDEVKEKRDHLAVMLPYYGLEYLVNEKEKQFKLVGPISLENFFGYELGKTGSLNYSSNIVAKNDSIVAILELPLEDGKSVSKFYLDDEFSLQNKYFYLKDTLGIDNVALNALSYYKTKEKIKPMWAVLALTYGKEREKLGWIIASFLMGFIPIGFVFSIYRNWEVRNALAKHENLWTRFIMLFVLFFFLFLTAANIIPRKGVAIVVAIVIIGAFFIYILIKKAMMRSKKYVNIIK